MERQHLYSYVGRCVRTYRLLRDMTQLQLGDAVGLTQMRISGIENGRGGLTLHGVYEIAEALGVSPAELCPDPKARPKRAHDVLSLKSTTPWPPGASTC